MLGLRVALRDRYVGVMIEPAVYLVVAMVPFFACRNMWMQGMAAIEANGGLLGYRQVKPLDAMAFDDRNVPTTQVPVWVATRDWFAAGAT